MVIKLQERIDCTSCGLVKSGQKGFAKVTKIKANKSADRVCIDTTGTYAKNTCGTHYWMCALYEFTDMYWLQFAKIKSEMVKFVTNLLGILKVKGTKFEYIRYENAGEHMSKSRTLC